MKIFDDASAMGEALPGGWLGIGNFDGLHVGHRSILAQIVARARRDGAPALAMTFRPHPAALLSPRGAPARLVSASQQEELLAAAGLDGLLVQRFDASFADVSADDFVRGWLLARLRLRGLVVGEGFRFGKGRAGDVPSLRAAAGSRLDVVAAEPVLFEDEVASSTRVRRLLAEGDVASGWRLLERPHVTEGVVVAGDGRGKQLGFPTANVDSGDQALPRGGVYVTALRVGERRLRAISNVGTRPTFDGSRVGPVRPVIVHEVHALEDPGDLRGAAVRVAFLARIRDERKFDGPAALVSQIRADIAECEAVHGAHPPASLAGPAF